MRIAVLDDDPTQLSYLVHALTGRAQGDRGRSDFLLSLLGPGEALRRSLRQETYDLLVLDWNVPDLDGVELLHWLRNFRKSEVPVIMLSSRGAERDVAGAFGIGADDYVVKPFRTLELCARIRRLMARRPLPAAMDIEHFGDWRFDRPNLNVQFPAPDGKIQQISLTDHIIQFARRWLCSATPANLSRAPTCWKVSASMVKRCRRARSTVMCIAFATARPSQCERNALANGVRARLPPRARELRYRDLAGNPRRAWPWPQPWLLGA